MPIGFSNGLYFEDEFEMTNHFHSNMPVIDPQAHVDKQYKDADDVSIDWDAEMEKLPPRLGEQRGSPITNVGDIFSKPKAPQVGKPELAPVPPVDNKLRLNDAFQSTLEQERDTIRNIKNSRQQANLDFKI